MRWASGRVKEGPQTLGREKIELGRTTSGSVRICLDPIPCLRSFATRHDDVSDTSGLGGRVCVPGRIRPKMDEEVDVEN